MDMISVQLNEYRARDGNGFAFTLQLPAVPRVNDSLVYAGRTFIVRDVEWHPGTDFPVHLYATEHTKIERPKRFLHHP